MKQDRGMIVCLRVVDDRMGLTTIEREAMGRAGNTTNLKKKMTLANKIESNNNNK